MNISINSPSTNPFSLTYLIEEKQRKVLLLKSIPGKQLTESKWLGVGEVK